MQMSASASNYFKAPSLSFDDSFRTSKCTFLNIPLPLTPNSNTNVVHFPITPLSECDSFNNKYIPNLPILSDEEIISNKEPLEGIYYISPETVNWIIV